MPHGLQSDRSGPWPEDKEVEQLNQTLEVSHLLALGNS